MVAAVFEAFRSGPEGLPAAPRHRIILLKDLNRGAVRQTLRVSASDAGGTKLHSVRGMPARVLERFLVDMNREGFPRARFSDSGSMRMKEVGMDGSRAFTGSS
jgi:hypothetical protein